MRLRDRVHEWRYWHIGRPAERAFLRVVWRLPRRVVYWCVIRAAAAVEPNGNPSQVTAEAMLKEMDYGKTPNGA